MGLVIRVTPGAYGAVEFEKSRCTDQGAYRPLAAMDGLFIFAEGGSVHVRCQLYIGTHDLITLGSAVQVLSCS